MDGSGQQEVTWLAVVAILISLLSSDGKHSSSSIIWFPPRHVVHMMLPSSSELLVSCYHNFTLRIAHNSLEKEQFLWGREVMTVIHCLPHMTITVALLKDSVKVSSI